jgi:YggT family protein
MEQVSAFICIAVTVFWLVLLVRVIVSLLVYFAGMRPPSSGVLRSGHQLLYDVTEPVLRPLRRVVPPAGPLDLSVLVAFIIITVLQRAFC